jgi:hypothetical protein
MAEGLSHKTKEQLEGIIAVMILHKELKSDIITIRS